MEKLTLLFCANKVSFYDQDFSISTTASLSLEGRE